MLGFLHLLECFNDIEHLVFGAEFDFWSSSFSLSKLNVRCLNESTLSMSLKPLPTCMLLRTWKTVIVFLVCFHQHVKDIIKQTDFFFTVVIFPFKYTRSSMLLGIHISILFIWLLLDTSQLVFSFFYHLLNFAIHFPLPGHCFQCDQPAIFSSASLMWLSLPTLFNP